jgi:hypothetical protein
MSALKDLAYDIEQLYIDGLSAAGIAAELNCPIGVVKGWIDGNSVADTQQEEDEIYSPFHGA